MSDKETEERWSKLDADLKEIITLEKLKETNRYNSAIFAYKFIKTAYGMLFDITFMVFLFPAAIYHGVTKFYSVIGLCDGSSGYGFELIFIGITFSLLMVTIEMIYYSGLDYINTFVIEKMFGFSTTTEA